MIVEFPKSREIIGRGSRQFDDLSKQVFRAMVGDLQLTGSDQLDRVGKIHRTAMQDVGSSANLYALSGDMIGNLVQCSCHSPFPGASFRRGARTLEASQKIHQSVTLHQKGLPYLITLRGGQQADRLPTAKHKKLFNSRPIEKRGSARCTQIPQNFRDTQVPQRQFGHSLPSRISCACTIWHSYAMGAVLE